MRPWIGSFQGDAGSEDYALLGNYVPFLGHTPESLSKERNINKKNLFHFSFVQGRQDIQPNSEKNP